MKLLLLIVVAVSAVGAIDVRCDTECAFGTSGPCQHPEEANKICKEKETGACAVGKFLKWRKEVGGVYGLRQ